MDHKAISAQVLVEHEMLTHITSALRTILDWKQQDYDLSRKLASLRFAAQSYERHLERLMSLEEHDGYMDAILEVQPQLTRQIEALRKQHGEFRRALGRLVYRLEHVSPTDREKFAEISTELADLLNKVDEHSACETDLLQEAFLRDEGGQD